MINAVSSLDGLIEIRGEFELTHGVPVHVLGEDLTAAGAAQLGRAHREVGIAHE